MMYQITDKNLKKLKTKIWNRFLRFKAVSKFDELTILKQAKSLYNDLETLNMDTFNEIALESYNEVFEEYKDNLGLGEKDKKLPTSKDIKKVLKNYDPVTNYVYINEVDRKRQRFVEDVIANQAQISSFRRAFNVWYKQAEQYCIEMERESTLKAYGDCGIEKVKWVAEKDGRTCEDCLELDGKIFTLDEVPSQPHINCRCEVEAVKEEDDGN